ncbi:hypothetical protein CYMTET_56106 [Cymbomonas tetramitiformis]|uniref:Uncharacterized protein n=1 Tax=Cymbomonas tetramitiformis TaxID=36881 RepID=A0AAE0BCT0_9CHLO|nr:hypothetical protein CYMTET_56106 [Cymbomonas tetramitiformis]
MKLVVLLLLIFAVVGDATSYLNSTLPSCALHLYRHVSKTGGTTVRFLFDKQVVMGEWEYPLSYGFKENEWEELLERWRGAADKWILKDPGSEGPRVLVEVRGNWPSNWPAENFVKRIMPDVLRLKEEYGKLGCKVTTSFIMREPVAQYLSFYHYYIKKLQDVEVDSLDKGIAARGKNIEEWAANVPDMQVRELLGTKCTTQMREPGYVVQQVMGGVERVGPKLLPKQCQVRPDDLRTFKSLVKQMDVVGVTSRFDEFLLQLSDVAGIQHVQYVMSNSGKHEKREDKLDPEDVKAIKKATSFDFPAYRYVLSLQDAYATPEFQERLEDFQINETVWGSEAKAQQIERVVPTFFTEPTGGGQATAYIYMKPVMLVERDNNLPCRKGCTFD